MEELWVEGIRRKLKKEKDSRVSTDMKIVHGDKGGLYDTIYRKHRSGNKYIYIYIGPKTDREELLYPHL